MQAIRVVNRDIEYSKPSEHPGTYLLSFRSVNLQAAVLGLVLDALTPQLV